MKVRLELPKENAFSYQSPAITKATVTWALPFFQSKQGKYVHRVRSGTRYLYLSTGRHHVGLKMWCGQLGFLDDKNKGRLIQEPDASAIHCATCEGRAIGAGQVGSHMICNRIVKYTPRS